jgi:hypothetical protein
MDYHPVFAQLFEGLPVVWVRNWTEVTAVKLQAELRRIDNTEFAEARKIYWPYWLYQLTWAADIRSVPPGTDTPPPRQRDAAATAAATTAATAVRS